MLRECPCCHGFAARLVAGMVALVPAASLIADQTPARPDAAARLSQLIQAHDWQPGGGPAGVPTGPVNRDPAPCSQSGNNCQALDTSPGFLDFGSLSSDAATGTFTVADNFTAASAGSITTVCFWGRYQTGAVVPAIDQETFTVTYYTDAGGIPSTVKAGPFTLSNPDGPGPNGNLLRGAALVGFGTNAFSWTGTHAAVTVAANECVWIEVRGNGGSVANRWRWLVQNDAGGSAPFGDFRVFQRPNAFATYDPLDFVGADTVFCVNVPMRSSQCSQIPQDPNAHCATAQPLTIGGAPVGTLSLFGSQDVVTFCKDRTVSGSALWYSVVGNGTTLTASSCSANTDFDTVINVYCGSCAALNCVESNDDAPGACAAAVGAFPSEATWVSRAGVTYFIAIFGFEGAFGNFEIRVTSDGTVASNQPACVPDRVPVDTSGATFAENEPCGTDANSDCFLPGVQTINLNTLVRGIGSSENSNLLKDRDEYFINTTVSQDTWFDIEYNTEYPAVIFLDDLSPACDPLGDGTGTTLNAAFADYFTNPNLLQVLAPAGSQLMFFTLPLSFGGLPCALPNEHDYTFIIRPSIVGACCVPATECFVAPQAECDAQAGAWLADGSTCSPTACDTGVCCAGATCAQSLAGACSGPNKLHVPSATPACNSPGNAVTPCCKADYNHVGGVTVQDIFDFLAGYFSSSPLADINGGGVSVQDIFDYLAAYFAGCI